VVLLTSIGTYIYLCIYICVSRNLLRRIEAWGLGDFDVTEDFYTRQEVIHCIIWVSWLIHAWDIHICVMPHAHVWYDSPICMSRLIRICDMTIHICYMTHSYVWHDSFTRETWLFDVWFEWGMCVLWLIHVWDMTHW